MGGRLRLFCESLFFFFGGVFGGDVYVYVYVGGRMIGNVYVYVDRLVDDTYIYIWNISLLNRS